MTERPIPVHVGSEAPARWSDIEELQRKLGNKANQWLRDKRRPAMARDDLDWTSHGLEPRWVGLDTADCAAAIAPSAFHGQGADEFDRFREGAATRGEVALVISPIGGEEDDPRTVSLFRKDASVILGHVESSIVGRRLGLGANVQAADNLDDADRQLALRLASLNPAPQWHTLTIAGAKLVQASGQSTVHPPQGTLIPIMETELGEPVVGAWISPDGVERRYIVPADTPWPQLLNWLTEQALPEFVPGAMQRARRHLASDPALMTRRERVVRNALADLEADYRARKSSLTEELIAAQAAATSIREGLLYGTGVRLVESVKAVLQSAGIAVVDVDEMLGDTKNADLLCTFASTSVLVEVKSASGNAPERAYEDLVRHLREWAHLPDAPQIVGGALVVNHQIRKPPQERSMQPYARPEFLAAQTQPVVTTLELLQAWRENDWSSARSLLFGEQGTSQRAERVRPHPGETDGVAETNRKRGWFGRRS